MDSGQQDASRAEDLTGSRKPCDPLGLAEVAEKALEDALLDRDSLPGMGALQHRIDADNNILIETRTSNFLKSNFAETYYLALKVPVSEIQLPLEIANKNLILSPYNPRLELNGLWLVRADYGSLICWSCAWQLHSPNCTQFKHFPREYLTNE